MIAPFLTQPNVPSRRSGFRGSAVRTRFPWALAALLTVLPLSLHGVRSESVIHQSYADFAAGELENVSLHRDGRLVLAPAVSELGKLSEPVIWSAVAARDGTVFIGAGNEGTVHRLTAEGKLEALFSTDEVITRAMAVDSEGRLYVGTSPDGRVYRYAGDGEVEVFFDPRETYIWALLFNSEGDLFVGTGDKGRIYRIAAGTQAGTFGEIYFDADEAHISTLAWDEAGRLLAGTSPNGYVYRIESADEVSVLFNSPDEEIRHIQPGTGGEIFVSTFSSAPGPGNGAAIAQAIASLAESGERAEETGVGSPAPPTQARRTGGSARPSTLYRVDGDGFFEPFWGLAETAIHSLGRLDDGSLLIGTGNDGRVFSLTGFQTWKLRQTLPAGSKVSALVQVPGTADVLAFTSNPARIYRLDFGLSGVGEFLSKIQDAGQVARWGRIYTEGGDGVTTFVRSGNTEKADRTWTSWREVDRDGNGPGETAPGRYFQYRLNFDDPAAEVRRVRFFYRHANAAPVIQALRVITSDLGLERYDLPPQQPSVDLDQLVRETRPRSAESLEPRQQIRGYERPGMVTAVWQARDANDDDLSFTVQLRRAGEDAWDTIADDVRHPFYSFNSTGLEDGEYQVKVIASDHLSNRPGEARTARRVSENFLVDNVAPEIQVDEVTVTGDSATIRFRAVDQTSVVTTASYVLNGGERMVVFPEDGLFDAREERFQLNLEKLPAGRNHLLLQVSDEAGNQRVRSVTIEVKTEP